MEEDLDVVTESLIEMDEANMRYLDGSTRKFGTYETCNSEVVFSFEQTVDFGCLFNL